MPRLSVTGLVIAPDGRRRAALTFAVGPNEAVALVGASGVGKSSALRAIAGLDAPEAGQIRLDERAVEDIGMPAFRRRVLYLAQQSSLGEDTVEAALRRPFSYRSAAGQSFDSERARALLSQLDLPSDVLTRLGRDLSVGEQQRVAAVRALLLEPDVLLADEPTSALDPESTVAVEAALKTHLGRGGGLILVSHATEQRARLTTREIAVEMAS